MIVEDESYVARDIKDSLENMGFSVSSITASGEESIERAERERPDAVLMDIHLRDEMDGIEAAEQIFSRFGIPVVFLTAYTDDQLVERAKKVGSFGYLVKPFEDHELHATIEISLYKARMEAEREKLISELEEALALVKQLSGILPICAQCKKIRDEKGHWIQIETYIRGHSEANFSHGFCPDCQKELYSDFLDEDGNVKP